MVHFTLIRNFDPRACEVTIATNRRAVDVERSLALLRDVPGLRIAVLNLGWELTGRRGFGKLAGAVGNALEIAGALARLAALVWTRRIEVIHSTDRPRDALLATLLARLT